MGGLGLKSAQKVSRIILMAPNMFYMPTEADVVKLNQVPIYRVFFLFWHV